MRERTHARAQDILRSTDPAGGGNFANESELKSPAHAVPGDFSTAASSHATP